jgi:hypothetical protein
MWDLALVPNIIISAAACHSKKRIARETRIRTG